MADLRAMFRAVVARFELRANFSTCRSTWNTLKMMIRSQLNVEISRKKYQFGITMHEKYLIESHRKKCFGKRNQNNCQRFVSSRPVLHGQQKTALSWCPIKQILNTKTKPQICATYALVRRVEINLCLS